jgi:hypothetical protein
MAGARNTVPTVPRSLTADDLEVAADLPGGFRAELIVVIVADAALQVELLLTVVIHGDAGLEEQVVGLEFTVRAGTRVARNLVELLGRVRVVLEALQPPAAAEGPVHLARRELEGAARDDGGRNVLLPGELVD